MAEETTEETTEVTPDAAENEEAAQEPVAETAEVAEEATETTEATEESESAEEPAEEEAEVAEESSDESSDSNGSSDDLVAQLPSIESDDTPRKEVVGGRAYEIIYIVKTGEADAVEESVDHVKSVIEGKEGAVDNVRVSDTRRLAYPIQKETEGVYVVINARFASNVSEELERYFHIEETVLRHMILREDS